MGQIKLTKTTSTGTEIVPFTSPERIRIRQGAVGSLVKKGSMDSEVNPFSLPGGFTGQPDFAKITGRRGPETRGLHTGPATTNIINGIEARRRSRYAVLASPYASRAIDILESNVVGDGLQLISEAPDPEFKKQLETLWKKWCKKADTTGAQSFEGMQALAYRSAIEGGDCFIRFRPRKKEDNLPVPLQLQLIESEQCPLFKNEPVGKASIVGGVQLDVFGKPVFYHMFPSHPQDFMLTNMLGASDTVKIPAQDMLHVHEVKRPSATRGLPILAQMVIKISDLDRYMDAELVRKKASALIGGFITEPYDQQQNNPLLPTRKAEDREPVEIEAMEAGTFPILPQGFDVRFTAPADVGLNFQTFLKEQVNMIAASVNVLPSQLTGDIIDISDRTLRAKLLEQRRILKTVRKNVVVFQICQPVFDRWFDTALISGDLIIPANMTEDEARAVRWIADPWKAIHPLQDIQAEKEEINAGLKNRDEALLERGIDPEVFDEQAKKTMEREEKMGIAFDVSVSQKKAEAAPSVVPGVANQPDPEDNEEADQQEQNQDEEQ